ncbi:MAG: hypothetical protein J6W21_02225 [Bacteroidaceae bacterium]|nr:hypothetical protein [Bacteroidaceae bacterium]
MEEQNNLTAERSLEIIRESIESSQHAITKNSSWTLIWWGSCVVAFSLLIAYLWENHGGPAWNALWAVMWGTGYLGEWIISKHKKPVPTNFVSKTIGHVWATFGIFMCLFGLILGLIGGGIIPVKLAVPETLYYINITSIISLCFGIASTITGFIIKNRIVQICGLIAGLGGFFCALQYPWVEQLYVMAVVAIIGMIIPGVIIYYQNKE